MQPQLDHLVQYEVERISTHEKKPSIVFEDGRKIVLPRKPKQADALIGSRLQSIEDKGPEMELNFTKGQPGVDLLEIAVPVTKGEYTIYDPRINKTVDPHQPFDPNQGLPPEPTARISEGPTDEEVGKELSRGEQGQEEEAGTTE
jgi:hypothetical protein